MDVLAWPLMKVRFFVARWPQKISVLNWAKNWFMTSWNVTENRFFYFLYEIILGLLLQRFGRSVTKMMKFSKLLVGNKITERFAHSFWTFKTNSVNKSFQIMFQDNQGMLQLEQICSHKIKTSSTNIHPNALCLSSAANRPRNIALSGVRFCDNFADLRTPLTWRNFSDTNWNITINKFANGHAGSLRGDFHRFMNGLQKFVSMCHHVYRTPCTGLGFVVKNLQAEDQYGHETDFSSMLFWAHIQCSKR